MFDRLKKGFYWGLLIILSFICVVITLKLLYYLFIILATIGLALIIKILYEKRRRN
jgi:uncharacterized membrane protein